MSDDPQRAHAGSLLLERLELRRDIAAIKADLIKRAETIVRFGTQLRSNPQAIQFGDQPLPGEYAQRAQKFSADELDSPRIGALVDELRKKAERLQPSNRKSKALVVRWSETAVILFLLAAPLAAQPPAAPQQAPQPPMTFFVTSEGSGKGADLGGLAGADQRCQTLAAAAGAGDRTWHAYLSTQATATQPAVNARDRIGTGPWYNSKGARIAKGLSDLHGDTIDEARIGSSLTKITALTEKGEVIAGPPDDNQRHDILTGSQPDGRAFTDTADHTCHNWTSSTDGAGQIGHPDHTGGPNTSWNSSHTSRGCSQDNLKAMGGAGLFYCFAVDKK